MKMRLIIMLVSAYALGIWVSACCDNDPPEIQSGTYRWVEDFPPTEGVTCELADPDVRPQVTVGEQEVVVEYSCSGVMWRFTYDVTE